MWPDQSDTGRKRDVVPLRGKGVSEVVENQKIFGELKRIRGSGDANSEKHRYKKQKPPKISSEILLF